MRGDRSKRRRGREPVTAVTEEILPTPTQPPEPPPAPTTAPPSAPPPDPDDHGDGPSARRLWEFAIMMALAGLAARVAWYLHHGSDQLLLHSGTDGAVWITQAHGYLRGAIVDPVYSSLADVYREAYPPGYPLFLAALWKVLPLRDVLDKHEYVVAIAFAVQSLLAAATTLITFAVARRVLFGLSALLPPLIMTTSFALVDLPNRFANETLLAFLLAATVLMLVKAREASRTDRNTATTPTPTVEQAIDGENEEWSALDEPPPRRRRRGLSAGMLVMLAGLTSSYAVLTQPRMAIMLPFVAAWLATALPWRFTLGFVILALLLPAGWIARDFAIYDEFVPISLSGPSSLYEDNVDPIGGVGFVRGATPPQCSRELLADENFSDHLEWARCMQREGFAELVSHPGTSALAVGDRFAALLSPWNPAHARGTYDSRDWDYHRALPSATRTDPTFKSIDAALSVVWISFYALLIVLGVLSLWSEGPGSTARLIAIPLITLPLAHLALHAENRLRVPLLPLLSIALALGVIWLIEHRNIRINR